MDSIRDLATDVPVDRVHALGAHVKAFLRLRRKPRWIAGVRDWLGGVAGYVSQLAVTSALGLHWSSVVEQAVVRTAIGFPALLTVIKVFDHCWMLIDGPPEPPSAPQPRWWSSPFSR